MLVLVSVHSFFVQNFSSLAMRTLYYFLVSTNKYDLRTLHASVAKGAHEIFHILFEYFKYDKCTCIFCITNISVFFAYESMKHLTFVNETFIISRDFVKMVTLYRKKKGKSEGSVSYPLSHRHKGSSNIYPKPCLLFDLSC